MSYLNLFYCGKRFTLPDDAVAKGLWPPAPEGQGAGTAQDSAYGLFKDRKYKFVKEMILAYIATLPEHIMRPSTFRLLNPDNGHVIPSCVEPRGVEYEDQLWSDLVGHLVVRPGSIKSYMRIVPTGDLAGAGGDAGGNGKDEGAAK
jgi:hypothetical protein